MLSRIWNVETFFKHAAAQLYGLDSIAWAQRYELVNVIQYNIVTQMFGMMSSAYMTPTPLVLDTTGSYGTGGMSYAIATKTLTATMSTAFASTDVGKLVAFRDGGTTYLGVIETYGSATTVILQGNNLPAADIAAVSDVIMIATTPSTDYISIATINIMRAGGQLKLALESTATTTIKPLTLEEFRKWSTTAMTSAATIAWCLSGEEILLKRSSDLSSYGTLTLRYPRVPTAVTQDTDYLDLPDGPPMNLALVLMRKELSTRFTKTPADFTLDLQEAVKGLATSYGVTMKTEEIQQKVRALT